MLLKADSNVSKEKLHGFDRCAPLVRIYFLVNAFGFQPAESLNFELFEDDRILRRAPELKQAVLDDVEGLLAHPSEFWSRLARLVDSDNYTFTQVREEVFNGLHTCLGYLHYDFFCQLNFLPVSLTQGDTRANLEALRARPYDSDFDYFAYNVKRCLDAGRPSIEAIVESL